MCRLVTLKSVAQVVLVVHVTLCAQVIVEAHLALPSHSHDAVLLAAVTDDVGVAHTWRGRRGVSRKVSGVKKSIRLEVSILFCYQEKNILRNLSCHVMYSKMQVVYRYVSPIYKSLRHSRHMSCPYRCYLSQ